MSSRDIMSTRDMVTAQQYSLLSNTHTEMPGVKSKKTSYKAIFYIFYK